MNYTKKELLKWLEKNQKELLESNLETPKKVQRDITIEALITQLEQDLIK